MSQKIKVRCRGNFGTHRKYGPITKGRELEIDPKDFGPQIFEKVKAKKQEPDTDEKE